MVELAPFAPFDASLLFVPASRPDRFARALSSGAGLVFADLEDSVPQEEKDAARKALIAGLRDHDGLAVRINPLTSAAGLADIIALSQGPKAPRAIMIPKVESPDEVAILAAHFPPSIPFIPMIETPRGLDRAVRIGSAPRVAAMMFGGADMAVQLGVEFCWEPLQTARALFVLACSQAGVQAIDTPSIVLDDVSVVAREVERARRLGFHGKGAIHPIQVPIINAGYSPSASDVAEAREAIASFEAGDRKAIRFKGRMLEAPIIANYRRILSRARTVEEEVDA